METTESVKLYGDHQKCKGCMETTKSVKLYGDH